jgi:hypothetical protein
VKHRRERPGSNVVVAFPLPECPGCDRPVRRDIAEANDGLCSECAGVVNTVRMAPVALPMPYEGRDDDTGYVEGYRPDVPPRRPR